MSGRKVTESVRIVIRTECGHRLEINGKGDASAGLLHAFACLGLERREALLLRMETKHADMLAADARSSR